MKQRKETDGLPLVCINKSENEWKSVGNTEQHVELLSVDHSASPHGSPCTPTTRSSRTVSAKSTFFSFLSSCANECAYVCVFRCVCVCVFVCLCVCVCYNEKNVPDEWQAQATSALLQVSSKTSTCTKQRK